MDFKLGALQVYESKEQKHPRLRQTRLNTPEHEARARHNVQSQILILWLTLPLMMLCFESPVVYLGINQTNRSIELTPAICSCYLLYRQEVNQRIREGNELNKRKKNCC